MFALIHLSSAEIFTERVLDIVSQLVEGCLDFFLGRVRKDELHVRDSLEESRAILRLDLGHGSRLGVDAGVHDGSVASLVERADDLHHANSLPKRAVAVVLTEGVLLEELVLDDVSDVESSLLIFGKRVLADQLHDFLQIVLLLKNLLDG